MDDVKRAEINIDLEKKCQRCGRGGALPSGYCLPCVTLAVEAGEFDSTFAEIRRQIGKEKRMAETTVDKETGEILDAGFGRLRDIMVNNMAIKFEYDVELAKLMTTITIKTYLRPEELQRLVGLQTQPIQVSFASRQLSFGLK